LFLVSVLAFTGGQAGDLSLPNYIIPFGGLNNIKGPFFGTQPEILPSLSSNICLNVTLISKLQWIGSGVGESLYVIV